MFLCSLVVCMRTSAYIIHNCCLNENVCYCTAYLFTLSMGGRPRGIKKGKVFPYTLPIVGPGADPGVQAVSPQVT